MSDDKMYAYTPAILIGGSRDGETIDLQGVDPVVMQMFDGNERWEFRPRTVVNQIGTRTLFMVRADVPDDRVEALAVAILAKLAASL